MNLIINAASIFKGGAEQVVNSFIHECSRYPEHQYHILLCDNIYSELNRESLGENFHFYRLEKRPASGIIHLFKTLFLFRKLEKQIKPDCVISTGGHGYWRPKAPLVAGYNIPHHVYDDLPYMQNLHPKKKIYWKFRKKLDLWFYGRADGVIVQTDDVKQRLSALIPNKPVYTVSNTVNSSYFKRTNRERFFSEKEENELRLLTLSANYDHKNLSVIREVIPLLQDKTEKKITFVVTLPEDVFEGFSKGVTDNSLVNAGPVLIKDCPALYNECDIMFLPTLLECFSASYAEAMVMRKPILTSDLPFAHTVCKDAAMYMDPLDAEDIANKIVKLAEDNGLCENLIVKGENRFREFLSPTERTAEFLRICEGLAENG